jgi:glutamate--cysteine ligase catalytic subunit
MPCGQPGNPYQDRVLNKYNDIPVVINEEHYLKLRSEGVDPALAQHIAHLFTRDPLVVFEGRVTEVSSCPW